MDQTNPFVGISTVRGEPGGAFPDFTTQNKGDLVVGLFANGPNYGWNWGTDPVDSQSLLTQFLAGDDATPDGTSLERSIFGLAGVVRLPATYRPPPSYTNLGGTGVAFYLTFRQAIVSPPRLYVRAYDGTMSAASVLTLGDSLPFARSTPAAATLQGQQSALSSGSVEIHDGSTPQSISTGASAVLTGSSAVSRVGSVSIHENNLWTSSDASVSVRGPAVPVQRVASAVINPRPPTLYVKAIGPGLDISPVVEIAHALAQVQTSASAVISGTPSFSMTGSVTIQAGTNQTTTGSATLAGREQNTATGSIVITDLGILYVDSPVNGQQVVAPFYVTGRVSNTNGITVSVQVNNGTIYTGEADGAGYFSILVGG